MERRNGETLAAVDAFQAVQGLVVLEAADQGVGQKARPGPAALDGKLDGRGDQDLD